MSFYRYALTILTTFNSLCLYGVTWLNDLDQGLDMAAKENKPLLAYFSGHWCIWCQRLEQVFLSQNEFDQLNNEMILVKIDYPQDRKDYSHKQAQWKQTYQIYSFPTLVIISAKGDVMGSVGYPRDGLVEFIARIRSIAKLQNCQSIEESKESTKNSEKSNANKGNTIKSSGQAHQVHPSLRSNSPQKPKQIKQSQDKPSATSPINPTQRKQANTKDKENTTLKTPDLEANTISPSSENFSSEGSTQATTPSPAS